MPTAMPASLTPLAALARKQKSLAVRNPVTEGQVLHLVDFERGGRRIVRAGFGEPEELLEAVMVGVPKVAADAVAIAADSFTTVQTGDKALINPITGKKWTAEQDLAVERGILAEGIVLMRFERDGSWLAGTLKYTFDRNRRRFRWDDSDYWDGAESDVMAEKLDMQARFPAVIRQAFAQEIDIIVYGQSTTDATRDLVDRMQKRLDLEFAHEIDAMGLLLEGPF